MVTCSIMWVAAGTAMAEDPAIRKPHAEEALTHLARATKLYNVRSFEEAAAEYKAGALVESAPIFDYNLGQCYRQLGKYKEAIWHYERFVKESPETTDHDLAVQGFITQMKAELEKKAMTAPPTEAAPTSSSTTIQPLPQPAKLVPPTGETDVEPWYADGFGWGLAGTGVVAVATSGVLFLDASSINSDANDSMSQSARDSLHSKADTRSLVATIIGIGGVGLLATGIVKLAIHPTVQARPTNSWNIGISASGLEVFGRF